MPVPDAITLARARAYLQLHAGLTQHDDFLGYLISAKSQVVAERLGLTVALTASSYADTIDVENVGQDRIRLPRYPVQSITALTDAETSVDTSAVYLKADRWVVLKGELSTFSQGKQQVVVTYVAGWDTIPGWLEDVVSMSVADAFNTVPKSGKLSEKIGAYAVALRDGTLSPLSDAADAVLSLHISPLTAR